MKLKKLLSASVLLLGTLLLATQPARADPVVLEDSAMDRVTAGNIEEGRGVVIGNSSESITNSTTGLYLSDEAQKGSNGLNLVNSAESAVANTVNIWAGNVVTISVEDDNIEPGLEVNQINRITQIQIQSATLSGYSRPEAEQTDIDIRSASENISSKIVNSNNTTDIFEQESISSTISTANVNTHTRFNIGENFYFEGHLGQGIAAAGHTEIEFDGGSADIALMLGGGITIEADTADATGNIDFLGMGDTGAAAGIEIEGDISLLVELTLPKMRIEINGAGCGVVMGSCDASSIVNEVKQTRTDNSTLDIVENYQIGQSTFSEEHISIYRSSFELESATAEYIIVDDSSLELNSDLTLALSDSAQKEAEGLNIVNAIASNVANATNVSRASQFNTRRSTLVLNQFNIVHHGH